MTNTNLPHGGGDRDLAIPAGPPLTGLAAHPGSPATEMLAAFLRAVALTLAQQSAAERQAPAELPAMLSVGQTAALLRISRMTVIRKADAGELPCLIVSRGARQKLRRFPRALIEDLVAGGAFGVQPDLKDCSARWLEEIAARRSADHTPAAGAARRHD